MEPTPQDIVVFIATPAYGGAVLVDFMISIMELRGHLSGMRIMHTLHFIKNESLITRARNTLASTFLHEKAPDGRPYTHLLFVDADVGFSAPAALRLLFSGFDVSAGCYPRKTINYGQLVTAVRRAGVDDLTGGAADSLGLEYNINFKYDSSGRSRVINNFVEVLDAATGFMCISRGTLERIIASKGSGIRYVNDLSSMETGAMPMYDLFPTQICPTSKRYLSEDYAFCRTWQTLGGSIWMDLDSRLTHSGTHTFRGDLGRYMKSVLGHDLVKMTPEEGPPTTRMPSDKSLRGLGAWRLAVGKHVK